MNDMANLLLSPRGRLGRQSFLTLALLLLAASVIVNLLPIVGPAAGLVLLWPWTMLLAKRLHDMSRSGLPVYAVAALTLVTGLVGIATAAAASDPAMLASMLALAGTTALLGGVTMVLSIALLAWAAMGRGVPGANRFGEPEQTPVTFDTLFGRS